MNRPRKFRIPISFSASAVLQFLGAFAAFLAAWVLPLNFPEFGGSTSTILNVVGCIFLLIATINLFVGSYVVRLLQGLGMRSRVLLPREGIVYLGVMLMLAVAALLGHSNMLLLVFGMMAGPFVLNGWVVISMLQKVSVVRASPASAAVGELFSVQITLRNGKRSLSSRLIEVRDVVEGKKDREEVEVTFVRVPPLSERTGSYQLQIARRGVYRLGPLRVSSRFPLGIGERGMTLNDRAKVTIHPAIGRLHPEWMRRERELAESTNQSNARVGVFDDEFHRIREYRYGDNPRSIHWRSSARRGEIMMREYEQKRESDLIILLDLFAATGQSDDEQEMAISLAATIVVEQTKRASSGTYRLLIAGNESVDIQATGAARFRETALQALAVTETSAKASLTWMLTQLQSHQLSAGDRFILITPRTDQARDLLNQQMQQASVRSVAMAGRTTIINASFADLGRVFTLIDSHSRQGSDGFDHATSAGEHDAHTSKSMVEMPA